MKLQVTLELLPRFSDYKVDCRMLAAFDAAEPAGTWQDKFFDNVIHIANPVGQKRSLTTLKAEFDGAFNRDGEPIQGQEIDNILTGHLETLTLCVYFHNIVHIGVEIVCTRIEQPARNPFKTFLHHEGVSFVR